MNLVTISTKLSEFERLERLLPEQFKFKVIIIMTKEVKPALIKSRKIEQDKYAIQIDLIRWQKLSLDQRDLLFWHEVAQIQNQVISQTHWERLVLGIGLGASLREVVSQNVVMLSDYLLVVGVVAYHLYQHHWGERSLRKSTAADQGAITLANQFGYALSEAYLSLQAALRTLMQQTPHKSIQASYAARLQVLQICNFIPCI